MSNKRSLNRRQTATMITLLRYEAEHGEGAQCEAMELLTSAGYPTRLVGSPGAWKSGVYATVSSLALKGYANWCWDDAGYAQVSLTKKGRIRASYLR